MGPLEYDPKQARRTAIAFCRLMRWTLGKAKFDEAVARNRAEPNPNVCHTHDFCDANMVMKRACDVTDVPDFNPEDEDDESWCEDRRTPVWNAAWNLAVAANFDPKAIA